MSLEGAAPHTESLAPREAQGVGLAAGDIVLGRYRIEGPIGRGGMGEVYEAVHVTLGSRVALKLPLGRNASGKGAARLLREAQVAASLDPERVVRVLDIGVLGDGRPVIVLERLDGETLAERMVRGPRLGVGEAVDFVLGACLGLAEAHARAIVHRDIKPSNLFIARRRDGSHVLKVLDFGVAALRADGDAADARLTESHAPVGSPPYMAPEQIRARPVDPRTDVWGLGVTLFQLLAGRLPFDGPSSAAFAASIVADEPLDLLELRGDVPVELAAVVRACLAKEPDQRPANATTLARVLLPFATAAERVRATVTLGGGRDSMEPTATQSRTARRASWVGLGVLGLVLFAWAAIRREAPRVAPPSTPLDATGGGPEAPIDSTPASWSTALRPPVGPGPSAATSPEERPSTHEPRPEPPAHAQRRSAPPPEPKGTVAPTAAPDKPPRAPGLLDQRNF